MIQIQDIAANLEEKLNAAIPGSGLNDIFPLTGFRFRILTDIADYKKAERKGNRVTYYIHGILQVLSSDVAGVVAESYNASLSTVATFLVPFVDTMAEDGSSKLGEAVRTLLDNVLSTSSSSYVSDGKITYYQGIQYSIASTGARQTLEQVGDCLKFTVPMAFFFIAVGLGSNSIGLYVKAGEEFERVYASKNGFARKSIQDGNIPSTDTSAKFTTSGTAMTINFDAPTRLNGYDGIVARYVVNGELPEIPVRVILPYGSEEQTTEVTVYVQHDAEGKGTGSLFFDGGEIVMAERPAGDLTPEEVETVTVKANEIFLHVEGKQPGDLEEYHVVVTYTPAAVAQYSMTFEEASVNGETNLGAATSVTLVEVM